MDPVIDPALSHADYHADRTALSSSQLKQMLISPAHYQFALTQPPKPTPAKDFGTAVHTALLEPARFAREYVVSPKHDRRTKAGREAAAAFEAAHPGCIFLTSDEATAIDKIRTQVDARPFASLLLAQADGVAERSVFWTDTSTDTPEGIRCKCRPDWHCSLALLDIKTTTDASARTFARDAVKYGYDLSAAFYIDGIAHAFGGVPLPFVFLVIEKENWEIALYEPDTEMLQVGRQKLRHALARFAQCRATDTWPGYQPDGEIEKLALPRWAL